MAEMLMLDGCSLMFVAGFSLHLINSTAQSDGTQRILRQLGGRINGYCCPWRVALRKILPVVVMFGTESVLHAVFVHL